MKTKRLLLAVLALGITAAAGAQTADTKPLTGMTREAHAKVSAAMKSMGGTTQADAAAQAAAMMQLAGTVQAGTRAQGAVMKQLAAASQADAAAQAAAMVQFAGTAQPADTTAAEGYRFTDTQVIATTPVKDQSRSGTCWCFSTLSFLESEILRTGGEPIHLSEMWIVRQTFMDKAEKYVRMHGTVNFAEGGASRDVTEGIRAHGIVPFEVYPGLDYGTEKPDFHELSVVLKAYLDAVIATGDKSKKPLSTAWKRGFNAILDEYFGPLPETFTYGGREYTPASFAASLPLDMDDYIDITSFTHHPFYTQFIIEVPDNWMWGTVYNVPLEEMMEIIDHSLAAGYTVAWGTDVSEKGFSRTKGIGIIPEADTESMGGTEAEKWGKLTEKEKEEALYRFDKPGRERTVTQELRQTAFDNYETTDDHGMLIMGTAVDQRGTPYYKVQNSWDVKPPYDGFWYFSRPFVAYKTTLITVNRHALPKGVAEKLGLKRQKVK